MSKKILVSSILLKTITDKEEFASKVLKEILSTIEEYKTNNPCNHKCECINDSMGVIITSETSEDIDFEFSSNDLVTYPFEVIMWKYTKFSKSKLIVIFLIIDCSLNKLN